ncbi:TPA: hypothetical protein ACNBPA_005146, partial [Escherichia coli]
NREIKTYHSATGQWYSPGRACIYIRAWLMQPFIPSASQGHGGVFLPGTQWKVCRFWDGMRLPFHQV